MKLYYDLHLHSCLSPCGDEEMTPNNIVGLARLLDLDVIALTDHNTAGNCAAVMAVGQAQGLLVLPGMELCTAEEVHMVCLFPTLETCEAFWQQTVRPTLPPIGNKAHIFGNQTYRDAADAVTGEEETLLITASSIGIYQVQALVQAHGGICYPAHIDRNSYSILSNLGSIDPSLHFACAELREMDRADALRQSHPALQKMRLVSSSDAHDLESMRPAALTLDCEARTPEAVLHALQRPL